jgi:hypothetical protein
MTKKGLAGAAIVAALLNAGSAWAHGDADDSKPSGGGSSVTTTSTVTTTSDQPKGPERFSIGLDWVLGFGKGTAIEQQFQSSLQPQPTNVIVSAPYRTQTFMLAAHYAFPKFGLGARFPMTIGDFSDASSRIRGENVFTNGGLEIALDLPIKLSESFKLVPQLAVVAPFAQGNSLPSAAKLASVPYDQFDKQGTYAYSANLAAAAAHGYEDDELYWPGRVGIVPRVTAVVKAGVLGIEPYVKVPILIDTHVDSDEQLRVEAVAGLRLAIAATSWFEPAVRVWTMVPIAAQSGYRDPVGVVEPSVRFHSGNTASLMVGGVLPFAGALVDPYVAGVRAALAFSF